MTDTRQAMQMALTAIERALSDNDPYIAHCKAAADALRDALSAQQEPVAGVVLNQHGSAALVTFGDEDWHVRRQGAKRLYTHPAPAVQPLTDEQCDKLRQENGGALNFVTLREFRVIARAIERALGIGGTNG